MNCCEQARQILKKLINLKRLLFTNYTDKSKQEELKIKVNRLVSKINIEYTRLRSNCKGLKDFDSPEIIGEISVPKVKDIIAEIKRYLHENCEEKENV